MLATPVNKETKAIKMAAVAKKAPAKARACRRLKELAIQADRLWVRRVAGAVRRAAAQSRDKEEEQPPAERAMPKKAWGEVQSQLSQSEVKGLGEVPMKNGKKEVKEIVSTLIRQTTKRVSQALGGTQEGRGTTLELRLLMLYGGVRMTSTGE